MAASSSDERRTAAIVILLAAALVLTAVLTWQAVIAGTYHRFAAQRAIRDFAAIATDELIRRASADVEGYGFAPMRQAIATRLSRGEPMPLLNQLHSGGESRLDYSLPLVRQLFLLDVNTHSVTPAVPAPLEAWMLAHFIPVVRRTADRLRPHLWLPHQLRSEEEGRRSLEIIDQEARRLSHLVDNVLLFSCGWRKLESDPLAPAHILTVRKIGYRLKA